MKNFIFIISLCIGALTNTTLHSMEHNKDTSQDQKSKNKTAYKKNFKLHCAVFSKNLKTVEDILLNNNANVNQQDRHGCTPLFVAAYTGNIDMVKLLLTHGAEHTANYLHDSPFDIATKNGHTIVARFLLDHWINAVYV